MGVCLSHDLIHGAQINYWKNQLQNMRNVRCNLTARENIWLGNIDVASDDGQILEAARRAGADAAISLLGRGYETPLGRLFDDGEELSVGQWQQVALARALMRDAQIMVLDEPTSAMDPKAEHEVYSQFRELARGKMTILISHRLSTVRMADRIYVLEDGMILEQGTHDQLLRQPGKYASLFNRQAQRYR